jgi:hypothetical protein
MVPLKQLDERESSTIKTDSIGHMSPRKYKGSIIIHIGLPKTATTFLQRRVFPSLPGIFYIHKPNNLPPLLTPMWKYFNTTLNNLISGRGTIDLLLRRILIIASRFRLIVVSNEGLSMGGPIRVWNSNGKSVNDFVRELSEFAGSFTGGTLKIVVGFRDVADWCASRYSESAKFLSHPSQADFENRMTAILQNEQEFPAFGWLHRRKTIEAIEKVVGISNVFTYQLEELEANSELVISDLFAFLRADLSGQTLNAQIPLFAKKENVKRINASSWKLSNGEVLVLRKSLASSIRSHFN